MRSSARIALAVGFFLVAGPALASGFSIYEQGAEASGLAGAWTARADGAAASWYNPAALVRLEGMEVQFGLQLITIGSDTQLESADPAFGLPGTVRFDAVQNNTTPPQLYLAGKGGERWAWGVGVNVPFGLVTEWEDRPVTLVSRRAELVSWVVNPNVAYKIDDRWSVALGLDWMFADIKEFSREQAVSPGQFVVADMTGDGDDLGFNLAVLFEGEELAVGLSYRAALSPEIDGTLTTRPQVTPDLPGKATLDLPAQAALGVSWKAAGWTMEADLGWAGWSSFETLLVDFPPGTAPDIVQREDWDDTMSYRFGASRPLGSAHELRLGAVYDENPIPDDTLRPSIPDGDRYAVTFGYGWTGGRWALDAYYMPLWFRDRDSSGAPGEAVIDGTYSSFVHLLGASVTLRF